MKQSTLAEWTGYTRATVNAALEALESEHNLITSETRRYSDGRNAGKVYRINFNARVKRVDSYKVKEIDSGPPARVNEIDTARVNAVDPDSVNAVDNKNQEHRTVNSYPPYPPKGGSGAKAPRSSREKTKPKKPKKELKHEFNPAEVSQDLPDNFDRELFQDFCARRLEVDAPMTLLALKQFITKHKRHPPEILDEMFRS